MKSAGVLNGKTQGFCDWLAAGLGRKAASRPTALRGFAEGSWALLALVASG